MLKRISRGHWTGAREQFGLHPERLLGKGLGGANGKAGPPLLYKEPMLGLGNPQPNIIRSDVINRVAYTLDLLT